MDITQLKTWADIEEASLTEPFIHMAVTLYERGDVTKEQALIGMVLGLADVKRQQHAQIMELINTRVPSIFVPLNPTDYPYK